MLPNHCKIQRHHLQSCECFWLGLLLPCTFNLMLSLLPLFPCLHPGCQVLACFIDRGQPGLQSHQLYTQHLYRQSGAITKALACLLECSHAGVKQVACHALSMRFLFAATSMIFDGGVQRESGMGLGQAT